MPKRIFGVSVFTPFYKKRRRKFQYDCKDVQMMPTRHCRVNRDVGFTVMCAFSRALIYANHYEKDSRDEVSEVMSEWLTSKALSEPVPQFDRTVRRFDRKVLRYQLVAIEPRASIAC